jgi:hypothetical protein
MSGIGKLAHDGCSFFTLYRALGFVMLARGRDQRAARSRARFRRTRSAIFRG